MEETKVNSKMLTPHFGLYELARGCENPPQWAVNNMRYLAQHILEPLREEWGGPITINSGYRSADHNRSVGGSATSLHLQGLAVDIKCTSFAIMMHFASIIVKLYLQGKISFHECYPSFNTHTGSWWLHVSTFKDPQMNDTKLRFDMNGKIYK